MPVSDAQRPHYKFFRALSYDNMGREILVGLSYDETEWYLAHIENELLHDRLRAQQTIAEKKADKDRYLQLNDRHELARSKRL